MDKITTDMVISDVLAIDKGLIPILMQAGMHCLGCPSAQGESLEEACLVHGIDADELVARMNDFLVTNGSTQEV